MLSQVHERRRRFRNGAIVLLAVAALFCLGNRPTPTTSEFSFHHDDVLGTSLDLIVRASDAAVAERTERAVLDEIERLRHVLSTYDAQSEISRFNASTGPVPCSRELLDALTAYDLWAARSRGAYSGQLGQLIRLWRTAEKNGRAPQPEELAATVASLRQPGWKLDASAQTATRQGTQPLNVDSLGKGFVIGQALARARAAVPELRGLLLNIGGDIFAWGDSGTERGWTIGVTNPKQPADNAPPLTQLALNNRAVATSAAYERGFNIGDKHYSHILDPRTGQPAEGVASATVVAADNVTANALATTLCVLNPDEGLNLVRATPGAECLIVAADGTEFRSAQFAAFETPAPAAQPAPKASLWPKGYEVALNFTLKSPAQNPRGAKRHYVVVWVEDAQGKPLRTVSLWANKPKYYKDLPGWWHFAQSEPSPTIQALTRATRNPGKYTIAWDGRDDAGQPVPPGTYTVFLEVAREHGGHGKQSARIVCGTKPATAELPAAPEFEAATLTYGPHAN